MYIKSSIPIAEFKILFKYTTKRGNVKEREAMVVLDIICRMPNSADIQIIEEGTSVAGSVGLIKNDCDEWHRKEIKEIYPGDEIIILIV